MNLIINADDFGMTKDVNRAIIELCNLGVTTSTTVMTNMPFCHEIVELANNKSISIGLHVNLTEGRPVSNPAEVSSLIDSEGKFFTPQKLKEGVRKGKILQKHVITEVKAQFIHLREIVGDRLDHFDSHQGTNKLKVVTDAIKIILSSEKKQYGIRVYNKFYLRIKNGSYAISNPGLMDVREFGLKRVLVEFVLRKRTRSLESMLYHPDGLILTSAHKGLNVMKILTSNDLNSISSGTFEIAFHPSTSLTDLPIEMSQSRVDEYNFMRTTDFQLAIQKYNLVNYDKINMVKR